MYIKNLTIANIRVIEAFEMRFPEPAGWHVIIGDNGAGKSSLIRAIALGLIGPHEVKAARPVFADWLRQGATEGKVKLVVIKDTDYDGHKGQKRPTKQDITAEITLQRADGSGGLVEVKGNDNTKPSPAEHIWSDARGWFSAGFGPFRRFTGGTKDWDRVYLSSPRCGAHLSVFGEDVALTEALMWLQELDYRRLKSQEVSNSTSPNEGQLATELQAFINETGLLSHGTHFEAMTADGPTFRDGNGNVVPVTQLSDGFRSILSLTFELIRQLVRTYRQEEVFPLGGARATINLPGVVLIDEIDAHLHPTWQTRIGEWFTRCFPQMQFIVTTHSPLVCRGATKGSIWRLAAPGSGQKSGEVTGTEKHRLILGNILDAYGTELFGQDVARSAEATRQVQEMAQLSAKKSVGKLGPGEAQRLIGLRNVFTTDDPTEY